MEAWRQWLLGERKTLLCDKRTKTHYEPRILLTPTGLLMEAFTLIESLELAFSDWVGKLDSVGNDG
jgi:hypothetical protein